MHQLRLLELILGCLLLQLFCVSAAAALHNNVATGNMTFGEVASAAAAGKWAAMEALLPSLNNASVPLSNGLEDLRDALLDIRDVLDIFPQAYPIWASSQADNWVVMRAALNDGYTLIGDYQDLHRVTPSPATQEAMLNGLLRWKNEFENASVQYHFQDYLQNPDPTLLWFRNTSELSYIFWGNTTARPSSNLTGIENIALLAGAQIQHLRERYFVLRSFENLTTDDNANYMHDYKKQLRALQQVSSKWYPSVLNTTSKYYNLLSDQSDACYAALVQTHSFVIPFLFYEAHGPADELANAEIALDSSWATLKTWFSANAWPDVLHLYDALLITPSVAA
jgi:hypothetical protein